MSESTYPDGVTMNDHIAHDMRAKRFPGRSTIAEFLAEREASPSPAEPVRMDLPDEIERAIHRFEDEARLMEEGVGSADELREARAGLDAAILTRLSAAEAGREEAPRWQPIETAPTDGTLVLVALNGGSTVARFDEEHGWYEVNNHWTDSWGGEIWPSLWMPLPEPPAFPDPSRPALKETTEGAE